MIGKTESQDKFNPGKKGPSSSERSEKKEGQTKKDFPSLEMLIAYNQEILRKLADLEEKSAPRAHIRL